MTSKLQNSDVVDLQTLIQYTFDWQDDIYIRVQRDGKWDKSSFADATNEEKAKWMSVWITDGHVPVRVIRESKDEEATGVC